MRCDFCITVTRLGAAAPGLQRLIDPSTVWRAPSKIPEMDKETGAIPAQTNAL